MKTEKQVAILKNIKRVLSRRTTKTWLSNTFEVYDLVDRYSRNYMQADRILAVLDRIATEKSHGDTFHTWMYFDRPGMNRSKALSFLDAAIAELSE